MKVWNGIERYPTESPPVVATLGNFDGVHRGHLAILTSTVRDAKARGLPSLLITFDPHPLTVIAPARRPRLLQTRGQKLDCLEESGMDAVLFLRFDAGLAALSGEKFFSSYLVTRVSLSAVHVGRHFRFGHDRAGDLALLERIGALCGFGVVGVSQVVDEGETISSSAIRKAVEEGAIERAARMLGRPFAVTGEVVRGDGRGKSLDFPTANLETDGEMIPRRGVYISEVAVAATRYGAITNVGVRPTFGTSALTVESHILDFEDDLYGERVEVRFLARLRDERRFDGPSELADQIARDRAAAVAFFQSLRPTLR